MITFNTILRAEGIDPATIMLVRHHDTRSKANRPPFLLWLEDPEALELYQRIQRKDRFPIGANLASFVATPAGATLFVGIYTVLDRSIAPSGTIDPVSGADAEGKYFYSIECDDR